MTERTTETYKVREVAVPERKLVVISAGVSDPSSTRLLADRAAQKTREVLRDAGVLVTGSVIELGPLAVDIARSLVSGLPSDNITEALSRIAEADLVIASTPVYKAGVSGLFKSFIDLMDDDLVIAKPVLLIATAGTSRHGMVVDDHLRPLFAFLRALPVPTSLFAAPEDWQSPELGKRIERAARELSSLVLSGVAEAIVEQGWSGYQHRFAGNATRAERNADSVDFDTDLMRLAAGGA
jgi:FMN reductase